MITPLLSVIIPTHKRPQFLPRAIESALQASPDGDVEVIVVPNGPDTSWQSVAEQFKDESRVKWHPVEKGHANVARNHGLRLARGEYIRFLDDDDYFYPENTREQLIELINSKAELSYSCLDHVDANGALIKNTEPEDRMDYVVATVGTGIPTHPVVLVFTKKLVSGLRWAPEINKKQDLYWAYSICGKREFRAIYFSKPTGAWVQHDGVRVSRGHHPRLIAKEEAKQLLKLAKMLQQQRRLTQQRAAAISIALWQCIHNGTMYTPLYWFRVAQKAEKIMPRQFPRTAMYSNVYIRKINPFWVELAIAPFRWLRILFGHKYTV